jgi:hypothetical protein
MDLSVLPRGMPEKSVCCLNALNSWQGADMNHESLLLNRCHHDPHPDHLGHPFHHPHSHYSILSVVVHSWAIGCQVTAAIDMVFCRAWRLAGNATLAIRPFVAEDFDARMKGATNRKLPWEW